MSDLCAGFGNTGYYLNCDANFKVMRGMFIVPTFQADGVTQNKIPAGTIVDGTYLTAALNNPDPTQRWYPLMGIEALTSERADPTLFTNPSGAIEFVKNGVKNVGFELRLRGSEFLGQIQACACAELSFFSIDIEGKLRGMISTLEEISDFFPVPIQLSSFYANLVDAVEENPEHLTVAFQYDITILDALLRVYPTELVTATLLSAKGLYDVYMDISAPTATGFTASLRTIYTDGSKYRPTGLVKADFTLEDTTTPAAITITTVTEVTPGVYVFVIPTTSLTDNLQLTPVKVGFDFTNAINNIFTLTA